MWLRQEAGDLRFQGARVDDFSQRSVRGQRQQVAGTIEGSGAQGAVVGVLLHFFRLGNLGAEQFDRTAGNFVIAGEERFNLLRIKLPRLDVGAECRQIPATLFEILIAGGAFLAVPALLIHQHDGRQQRQTFHGKGDVRQVRNRTVTILEIECVQELFGTLGIQFAQRLLHRERGTGIFCHGVRQNLWICAVDGVDLSRRQRQGKREAGL